jgi:hypothetical protein
LGRKQKSKGGEAFIVDSNSPIPRNQMLFRCNKTNQNVSGGSNVTKN